MRLRDRIFKWGQRQMNGDIMGMEASGTQNVNPKATIGNLIELCLNESVESGDGKR